MREPTIAPGSGRALRKAAFMEHAMSAWGSSVYRLALSLTRRPQDAEDVAQDVFMRLLHDTTAFRDDDHLKAWLLRVTINRCREVHRLAGRRPDETGGERAEARLMSLPDADPAADPEASALADLQLSPVWRAMQDLPESWRIAVHLHHVEGYPIEDIARITHCKASTVRTRLHRARKRLRSALATASENSDRPHPGPENPAPAHPKRAAPDNGAAILRAIAAQLPAQAADAQRSCDAKRRKPTAPSALEVSHEQQTVAP